MTTLLMVALFFFGILSYRALPVSDLPNVDFPAISVAVNYPGANPETMANNVTIPLEKEFLTISGLQTIASTSTSGSTIIVLQFSLDKSIDIAAQDVQAAINRATPQLPQNLPYAPIYRKSNPSNNPVYYASLTSATVSNADLYNYANTYIGERLSLIDGVSQVTTFGSPYAMRIQVNPQKLAAKGLGINDVAAAIQNQNVNLPTGSLFGDTREFTISVKGQISRQDAYNAIVLRNDNGAIVRLCDVGRAFDSVSDDKIYQKFMTQDESVSAVIFAVQTQPGVNVLSVAKKIEKMLPELEDGLPKAIRLNSLFNRADFINESVRDVQTTLLIALALVVLVIFGYLGKAIDTLIPSFALPISIMGVFSLMFVYNYTLDILSLLAITLGIGFLVDDAIVVLENIVRHVEQGKKPFQAALDGSKEISFTIISMTLCLAAVFIPMLYMSGIIGKLFHEFAVVIVGAVLISGFISLSFTPMLCSRFIPPHGIPTRVEKFSAHLNHTLVALYGKSLEWVLKHRAVALALAFAGLILSVVLFNILPKDFLPPDDLGLIVVHTQANDGTSPFQMNRYQDTVAEILRKNKSLESSVSLAAFPDSNKGILFLRLKPFKERPPIDEIANSLYKQTSAIPGIQTFYKSLPLITFQVTTSDVKGNYQYTLQGLNTQELYKYADIMLKKIKNLPGFTQVSTDLELTQPQLNIDILRDRASILNLSAQDVETAFQLSYSNSNLSPINQPDNIYYVIMELEPKYYKTPEALSQIYLRSSTNQLVPLNSVIEMRENLGPLNINHINGLPAVNIGFNLTDIPLSSAVKQLQGLARQTLPATVTGSLQGTASIFQSSFSNLTFLFIITIFIIYIVLGVLYENFFHPLSVMSTLPPAALGGLLVLILFNEPLSLYGFMGMFLLLGIVMKNGIIMVDFANHALTTGKNAHEAIVHACLTRFRPIFMTTISAIMGALPIALGLGGMTAQSRRSLGLVIVGGLIFAQFLTLYLTPVVYLYLETLREYIAKRFPHLHRHHE